MPSAKPSPAWVVREPWGHRDCLVGENLVRPQNLKWPLCLEGRHECRFPAPFDEATELGSAPTGQLTLLLCVPIYVPMVQKSILPSLTD